MADPCGSRSGLYRGLDAAERRARRREQLLGAGLELFGTRGYRNTTTKQICLCAHLTERYFYESFGNREELLLAVADRITEQAFAELAAALRVAPADLHSQARHGVRAYITSVAADRRRGRVHLLEVLSVGDAVERRRREVLRQLAGAITSAFGANGITADSTGLDVDLLSLGLVGAGNELLANWLIQEPHEPLDTVIDHIVVFYDQMIQHLSAAQQARHG